MPVRVIRGDARALPLADSSVDLIVTSPPYFGLRSYTDAGQHYAGQLGAENTPREYVAALLDCTREWVRVLKPSGSLFVNLGDKYSGNETGGALTRRGPGLERPTGMQRNARNRPRYESGLRPKSLIGLPWRYALGCIDDLGLVLRAEIVWAKPNGLPESVTDRVRRSHEQVFHFTRQPRYYAAVDEIREDYSENKPWGTVRRSTTGTGKIGENTSLNGAGHHYGAFENPLGKLPGSVWSIPSQPLRVPPELGVDHFAAFPMELPRRCILGWSPSGICTACGQGRAPVTASEITNDRGGRKANVLEDHGTARLGLERRTAITGYACACPDTTAPARRAVVLDPFGGTGTTALVADVLGRDGVSVDMSADYCRLAGWRTTDPGQRARASRAPKPSARAAVPAGQAALFGP